MAQPGTIIWLNGATGAGSGVLARALAQQLPRAKFFDLESFSVTGTYTGEKVPMFLNSYQTQFLEAIMQYSRNGGVAVVDYVLDDHLRTLEIMGHLVHNTVYLIEVFCPIDTLEARERLNAPVSAQHGVQYRPMSARGHFHLIYGRWKVDLVVNSTSAKAEELAKQVLSHINQHNPMNAFVYNLALVGSLVSQHLGIDEIFKPSPNEWSSVELSSDDLSAILGQMNLGDGAEPEEALDEAANSVQDR
jgi:chloramphenicol 3-O-phosphotransferase